MGIKKSVYLSDTTIDFIKKRGRDPVSWSEGINRTLGAAAWLGPELLPDLSHEEWQNILNVYAGCIVEYYRPLRIASDILDDKGVLEVSELVPELQMLVHKVYNLSQTQQYAVLDFVNYFWSNDWNNIHNFMDIVKTYKGEIK